MEAWGTEGPSSELLVGMAPGPSWCSSAGGALGEVHEEPLFRVAARGAGLGGGVGSAMETGRAAGEESGREGGAAFEGVLDFLSSETFPTWMGRVTVASADFRVTYKARGRMLV